LTIIKAKQTGEVRFGIRTIDESATDGKEFVAIDEIITMNNSDIERIQKIKIIDNKDYQPDTNFSVELYDPESANKTRLDGDDTMTKVTVLDEDFPGTIGFEITDVHVPKDSDKVKISLVRSDGSDGKITCILRTQNFHADEEHSGNAKQHVDY